MDAPSNEYMVEKLMGKRLVIGSIAFIVGISVLAISISLFMHPNDEQSTGQENIVSRTGTITFCDFEGGFYGIIGDDGEHYDPIALSETFQVPGLRVSFKVQIEENQISFHMWGKIVRILHIERLE